MIHGGEQSGAGEGYEQEMNRVSYYIFCPGDSQKEQDAPQKIKRWLQNAG